MAISGLNYKLDLDKNIFKDKRIAIIKTDYYQEMIGSLVDKANEVLTENGVLEKNIDLYTAPGSWEIPFFASRFAKSGKYDAVITLGIIRKGETYHFDAIANETARALMNLSIKYDTPMIYEILAVYDMSQAEDRTRDDENNKGIEAALAALKIIYEIENKL
jgi:6,7-dimethyl-8-ribityllumazine synthase